MNKHTVEHYTVRHGEAVGKALDPVTEDLDLSSQILDTVLK